MKRPTDQRRPARGIPTTDLHGRERTRWTACRTSRVEILLGRAGRQINCPSAEQFARDGEQYARDALTRGDRGGAGAVQRATPAGATATRSPRRCSSSRRSMARRSRGRRRRRPTSGSKTFFLALPRFDLKYPGNSPSFSLPLIRTSLWGRSHPGWRNRSIESIFAKSINRRRGEIDQPRKMCTFRFRFPFALRDSHIRPPHRRRLEPGRVVSGQHVATTLDTRQSQS